MVDVLSELVSLLGLERIEKHLFRGQSQDLGWGRVFGGQVLGQALSAAVQTVPEDRIVHSMHGYFMLPGKTERPIVYEVDAIRDGRSFTTRRVVAIQDGRAIFSLSASFQIQEDGFEHGDAMPEVTPPEALKSEHELSQLIAGLIPEAMRTKLLAKRPIEVRPVEILNPMAPKEGPPKRHLWIKTVGPLPDSLSLHQYLLAYASDFNFLGTSMRPHARSWMSRDMQVASVDHSMWFHRPFRFDDWLLYAIDSPSAYGARGFVRGQIYDRKGRLVASSAQEGLIRPRS